MIIQLKGCSDNNKKEAFDLIKTVVIDSFIYDGLDLKRCKKIIDHDLKIQKERLTNNKNFIVALKDKRIVGIIGYQNIGDPIKIALKQIGKDYRSIQEIVSFYVSPDRQSKGIGSELFKGILQLLKRNKYKYFALCTGYSKGKSFWTKKLNKATVVLTNYYSGFPCYVWIKKINDYI